MALVETRETRETRDEGNLKFKTVHYNLKKLFDILTKVMTHNEKIFPKLSDTPNPIMCYLKKYVKVYEIDIKTYQDDGLEDHIAYLDKIYQRCRSDILKGYANDKWLRTGNINIQFGEGSDRAPKDVRIMLTAIYNTACKLKDLAEKRLEGLPEEEYQNAQELLYPSIILLHLYRIFRDITPSDSKILGNIVAELESDLGITSPDKPTDKPTDKSTDKSANKPTEGVQANDITSGLTGFFSIAKGIMEKFGLEHSNLPTETEFTQTVNSLISNPTTLNTINKVFKDFQGTSSASGVENIGQSITNLVQSIANPEFINTIGSSLASTAFGAVQSNNLPPASSSAASTATTSSTSSVDVTQISQEKIEFID